MREWTKCVLAAAASALVVGAAANASPLVNLSILGNTSQNGTYTSNLSGLSAGQTIYVEVVGQLAPVTTSNGNGKTINSLSSTADGITALYFNLSGSTVSWTAGSLGLATASTTPPTTGYNPSSSATSDWTTGSGESAGSISGSTVSGIRPTLNGEDTGTIASPGDVLWFGRLTMGSASDTINGAWYTGSGNSGSFKINGGSNVFVTGTTESGSYPYVSYAPLTLQVPEPGSCAALGALVAGLLARRRRLC